MVIAVEIVLSMETWSYKIVTILPTSTKFQGFKYKLTICTYFGITYRSIRVEN